MENEKILFIRENLTQEELLCQLAEEASELAQAALKLRRAYDGTNPTPTSCRDAFENLKEEVADVTLLFCVLGLDEHFVEYSETMTAKLDRWCKRMKRLPRAPKGD